MQDILYLRKTNSADMLPDSVALKHLSEHGFLPKALTRRRFTVIFADLRGERGTLTVVAPGPSKGEHGDPVPPPDTLPMTSVVYLRVLFVLFVRLEVFNFFSAYMCSLLISIQPINISAPVEVSPLPRWDVTLLGRTHPIPWRTIWLRH